MEQKAGVLREVIWKGQIVYHGEAEWGLGQRCQCFYVNATNFISDYLFWFLVAAFSSRLIFDT